MEATSATYSASKMAKGAKGQVQLAAARSSKRCQPINEKVVIGLLIFGSVSKIWIRFSFIARQKPAATARAISLAWPRLKIMGFLGWMMSVFIYNGSKGNSKLFSSSLSSSHEISSRPQVQHMTKHQAFQIP